MARCEKCGRFASYFISAPNRFQPQGQWAAIQGEDRVHWCERCIAEEAKSADHRHEFVGEGGFRHCFHCGTENEESQGHSTVEPEL